MTERTLRQEATTVSHKIDSKGASRVSWTTVATKSEAGTRTTPLKRTGYALGRYADKPGSSTDFSARKQSEIDLEEQRR